MPSGSDANIATGGPADPARRAALKAGAAVAGTLLLSFHLPLGKAAAARSHAGSAPFAPNALIRVDAQGQVTLVMPQVEMGQGVYTAIAMILAEELDAAWEKVALEHAPPSDALYGNPVFHLQVTGNSNSIRAWWTQLRKAGASARAMLVEAAARQWKIDPKSCKTANGEVIDESGGGRRISYGQLVDRAATLTPPRDPPLKPVESFGLIGKPLKRLDTPDKVNGKATYAIDIMPPGVKFATLKASPVLGGKVGHVDDSKVKSIPGVRQIVVLDDLVAVVGDHMWAARQGLNALDVTWVDGPNGTVSSKEIWERLRAASEREGAVAKSVGNVANAQGETAVVEAAYELPFLAHAPMEPLNCTVHLHPDGCEIWTGTQVLSRAHGIAVKLTGLPPEKVVAHNQLLGGGFGRRLEVDMVSKAVRIAQQVSGPVKVVWTREEDIQQDVYRPMYHNRITAGLAGGKIVRWRHRVAGSSVMARWLPPAFQKGIDIDAVDSAVDLPYDIPNLRVEYVREEPPGVITGFWRGVGPNNNVFAIESFVDELAKQVGQDPVAFRLAHLGQSPRMKAALELVAEKSGWGQPLPARTGRGVAIQPSFGSYIATVAEVEVDKDGAVRVHRFVSAVDTGIVVNPDTVIAQLQGGLIFGLTAALYGEITIDRGRVQQSNFHDYRLLRMNETPAIEVHIVKSGEAPGGIGETGTTASLPAVRNAIFAATGIPLRRMPIDRDVLAGRKKV